MSMPRARATMIPASAHWDLEIRPDVRGVPGWSWLSMLFCPPSGMNLRAVSELNVRMDDEVDQRRQPRAAGEERLGLSMVAVEPRELLDAEVEGHERVCELAARDELG